MQKLIDPEQRERWVHPEDPDFVVTYRAFAGPTLSTDIDVIARAYIDYGVMSVQNGKMSKGGKKMVKQPKGGWSSILPADIQTVLFVEISKISRLTPDEVQDLPLPPG